MYSTYRLKSDELSPELIKAIKSTHHGDIEIIVQDIQDETDYLLSSPANKEHLLKAVENIEKKANLVNVKIEDL